MDAMTPFWDPTIFTSEPDWERWAQFKIMGVIRHQLKLRGFGCLFSLWVKPEPWWTPLPYPEIIVDHARRTFTTNYWK